MHKFVSLAALAAGLVVTPLVAAPALAADAPTTADADAFVTKAEAAVGKAMVEQAQADWVYQTYITQDTEALTARAGAASTVVNVANALGAAKYAGTPGLSYDLNRKLNRMRTLIVLPAPTRPGAAEEVATL
ncbi:MAG: M2 family metallopeptidase, partial [Sphingomonadales bacterium]|nr:M2 family metallopeptidase [Sphingomonadales bacterium]